MDVLVIPTSARPSAPRQGADQSIQVAHLPLALSAPACWQPRLYVFAMTVAGHHLYCPEVESCMRVPRTSIIELACLR